jgi:hypothetical protein
MPLLHPGDTFPQLTLNIPGAPAIQVPGWLAGEFGVVLFNRGATSLPWTWAARTQPASWPAEPPS